jgi:ABC-type Fe3+-hydroxamate transport system substrate-binding protein
MHEFKDQAGRTISLPQTPRKIISLVPSQTELLYDLGLRDEVIGITKFCIHPDEWFRTKPRIGGTKKIDLSKILQLNPDLVIANKEENVQAQVEAIEKHFPVWVSDIKNLDDALRMIRSIASIVGRKEQGATLAHRIQAEFSNLKNELINSKQISVAYLIWKDPLMTVGGDTFIQDILSNCNFKNVFGNHIRYPEISREELAVTNPEVILLSSEPYPFAKKHLEDFRLICPASKVVLVDGEMFSWYGSRLIEACDYIRKLVNQIHSEQ